MTLVTDFPELQPDDSLDIPDLELASGYSLRLGVVNGVQTLVIWDPKHEIHCAALLESCKTPGTVKAMLNNIGGAIFEREHPDQISRLIMADVVAKSGGAPMSEDDAKMLKRMHELMPA